MPADPTISQAPSRHHGNAAQHYPCHKADTAPGSSWSIEYGYCRHSLDYLSGKDDHRCPANCKHKAPEPVVQRFTTLFNTVGAIRAAAYTKQYRQENPYEPRI